MYSFYIKSSTLSNETRTMSYPSFDLNSNGMDQSILYIIYVHLKRLNEEEKKSGWDGGNISLDSFIRTGYTHTPVFVYIYRKCQNCDRENGLVVNVVVVAFASVFYQCPFQNSTKFVYQFNIRCAQRKTNTRNSYNEPLPSYVLLSQSSYGISFWNVTA